MVFTASSARSLHQEHQLGTSAEAALGAQAPSMQTGHALGGGAEYGIKVRVEHPGYHTST